MSRIIVESQNADNLKNLVKSAVENQLRAINFGITKTKRKLAELEKENGMDSEMFYKEYQEGKLGDDMKYIRWAGEYETLGQLQKDYNELQGTELCS